MWNKEKDLLLLKEIAAEGVLQHKAKSRERGTSWLNVANKMAPSFPNVETTSRAVRDRFKTLERKHKFKNAEEERGTGLGGDELTEEEELLEELIEIGEETEKRVEEENEEKKASVERERGQALEMRQRAMERIGETRKRGQETEAKEKKRRKSGETFDWLKEKAAMDRKLKEEELKERREERESQKQERVMFVQQLKTMQETNVSQLTQFMHQQDQQQHQQQQQFHMMQQQMLAMFQHQQQQTQLLMDLLKNDKK